MAKSNGSACMWIAWSGISSWASGCRSMPWSTGGRVSWERRNESRPGAMGEYSARPGDLVPQLRREFCDCSLGLHMELETGAVRDLIFIAGGHRGRGNVVLEHLAARRAGVSR